MNLTRGLTPEEVKATPYRQLDEHEYKIFLIERGWLECAAPDFEGKLEEAENDHIDILLKDFEENPARLRRAKRKGLWLLTDGFDYSDERAPEAVWYANRPPEDGMPAVKQLTRVPAGICRTLEEALELERHRPVAVES